MTGDGASSQTILVVDDDPSMRMILNFTLKSFGYLTLDAATGDEALQITRDHPEIRLIILDVVMRGLSGKKLADQLEVHLPKAAILFCSGHPPQTMSLHGINLDTAHFIQKPCRPEELRQKIEGLLASDQAVAG